MTNNQNCTKMESGTPVASAVCSDGRCRENLDELDECLDSVFEWFAKRHIIQGNPRQSYEEHLRRNKQTMGVSSTPPCTNLMASNLLKRRSLKNWIVTRPPLLRCIHHLLLKPMVDLFAADLLTMQMQILESLWRVNPKLLNYQTGDDGRLSQNWIDSLSYCLNRSLSSTKLCLDEFDILFQPSSRNSEDTDQLLNHNRKDVKKIW